MRKPDRYTPRVGARTSLAPTPWLVPVASANRSPSPGESPTVRMFCLPYAGGGASIYRQWGSVWPHVAEVFAVQPPGREGRIAEPLLTSMDTWIGQLATAVSPYLDRPYALFGHSMGALASFELAHELLRRGEPSPQCLIVSGRGAPHVPDPEIGIPMHQLSEGDFVERLKLLDGTPTAVLENRELMDLMVPVLRADFQVIETYSYTDRAPLPIPISVFGGISDSTATREDLEAWSEMTSNSFSIHRFQGGHFFLNTNAFLVQQAVGKALMRMLGSAHRQGHC
ncbi:MAG: alpha/beta fold hydrolase [Bacteroidota bacterium]